MKLSQHAALESAIDGRWSFLTILISRLSYPLSDQRLSRHSGVSVEQQPLFHGEHLPVRLA
jgi:hypothetical protein